MISMVETRPIGDLDALAFELRCELSASKDYLRMLEDQIRATSRLDEASISSVKCVRREAPRSEERYERQLARWEREPLTPIQLREVARLFDVLARVRATTSAIVGLAGR